MAKRKPSVAGEDEAPGAAKHQRSDRSAQPSPLRDATLQLVPAPESALCQDDGDWFDRAFVSQLAAAVISLLNFAWGLRRMRAAWLELSASRKRRADVQRDLAQALPAIQAALDAKSGVGWALISGQPDEDFPDECWRGDESGKPVLLRAFPCFSDMGVLARVAPAKLVPAFLTRNM